MAEPESPWQIVPLSKQHARESFESGEPALDEFLRKFARQNAERGLSRTFIASTEGSQAVVGYYTVRAGAVSFDDLPEAARKNMPRYPVPVAHLARLAVDKRFRKRGLGELLLMHALERAGRVSRELGIYAVEVVAKNEAARGFYERYGFRRLMDDPNHLYVPIQQVVAAFRTP